jgi:glycosyltransferase involved in cell wall biosynthesis
MRIVLTVHTFFPHWRAGTEVYALNLARTLKDCGHDVRLVCYEPSANAPDDPEAIDDFYEELPVHRIRFNQVHPDMLLREYFNPRVEKYLIEFYRRVQPSLVHVLHSMHLSAATITAAQYLGIPVVCTVMDFWYICPTYRLLRVDNSICPGPVNFLQCARCYRSTDVKWNVMAQLGRSDSIARVLRPVAEFVVAVPGLSSMHTLSKLRSIIERPRRLREIVSGVDMLIVPNKNTHRVLAENGITVNRVQILEFGLSLPADICPPKTSSANLRLAYIGTLDPTKGPHVALEALRRLPEQEAVELTVYGDPQANPPYFSRLKSIAGPDRRIKFAGTFPNAEIGRIFAGIDLLVIPSLWYENTPLVLYSAFASKTPVVVSNIGSLADAVRHGENGLVFEMGNSEDLARQIQHVLDDPAMLEKLRQGIPPVKPMEQNARELLEIYAALSAHPAVAKPPLNVASLSGWLEQFRSGSLSAAGHLGFWERAKVRSFFRRRLARFGDRLELCRFQSATDAGPQVNLHFVWRRVRHPDEDLTIVVQLLGDEDEVTFRADHRLGDAIRDDGCRMKDLATYSVPVQVPEQLHAGSYVVCLAVWDSSERRFLAPNRVRGWVEDRSENIRLGSIRLP